MSSPEKKGIILILTWILFFTVLVNADRVNSRDYFSYFPEIETPENLTVISKEALSSNEFLLISSLQGIIAQSKPKIYIKEAGSYEYWLNKLVTDYGVNTEREYSALNILEKYSQYAEGYVLTERKGSSVNAATAVAGIKQAVIVTPNLEEEVKKLGLKKLLDVRDKDPEWVLDNYRDELNSTLIFTQENSKMELRDYIIAARGFVFHGESEEFYEKIFNWVDDDAPRLGWGAGHENIHVGRAGAKGMFTLPADWAMNLSTLSGIDIEKLTQKPEIKVESELAEKKEAHFVSFVMSDGDNLQWVLGNKADNANYFASDYRGQFPMNWGIPPTLIDLAPAVMEWYYDESIQDYFVAGPSGGGYMYPSQNPDLAQHTNRLNDYFARADLNYTLIIDFAEMGDEDFQKMAAKYAAQPNIKGAVYYHYEDYVRGDGQIHWHAGMPFIAGRENLWDGIPELTAKRINSYSTDPEESGAYTIVNVHAWSHNLEDISTVVDNLDSHVKVVSLEELFNHIYKYKPEN